VNILFLDEARRDMLWFRHYYGVTFPAGKMNAFRHMEKTLNLLKQNPQLGSVLNTKGRRKLVIPRTPYFLIYQIAVGNIEIVRVWENSPPSSVRTAPHS
jgi:plasmid stabilization system protein ParE